MARSLRGIPPPGQCRRVGHVVKKIIIIVMGLVLLLGAAGGGLYAMGMLDGPLGLNEEVVAEGEDSSGSASGEGTDAEQVSQSLFVHFEPISAPVIASGRVKYQVIVTLSLQVSNLAAKNDVNAVLPRLRDAMHTELFTQPIALDTETGTIDLADLKRRVLSLTRDMVEGDGVEDILIVNVLRMGG